MLIFWLAPSQLHLHGRRFLEGSGILYKNDLGCQILAKNPALLKMSSITLSFFFLPVGVGGAELWTTGIVVAKLVGLSRRVAA